MPSSRSSSLVLATALALAAGCAAVDRADQRGPVPVVEESVTTPDAPSPSPDGTGAVRHRHRLAPAGDGR